MLAQKGFGLLGIPPRQTGQRHIRRRQRRVLIRFFPVHAVCPFNFAAKPGLKGGYARSDTFCLPA
jgi:hypothetical protein